MKKLGSIPFHPFLFAVYPILALLGHNFSEVDPIVALRPLLVSIAFCLTGLVLLRWALRSWHKAAIVTSLAMLMILSYGQLYSQVTNIALFDIIVGRHRILLPALSVILVAVFILLFRSKSPMVRPTQILNAVAATLMLFPLLQIGGSAIQSRSMSLNAEELGSEKNNLVDPSDGKLPDIYYIVLDAYTRADSLERDFGFDNSGFIKSLEELGFYVAECGRTNYSRTKGALTAALNMDYLRELGGSDDDPYISFDKSAVLLRDSQVRRMLEDIGYTTVAFDTGREWSRLKDADIYLTTKSDSIMLEQLDPFESMLVGNTLVRALADRDLQNRRSRTLVKVNRSIETNFPIAAYARQQLFILDQLPEIATIPDPTFAFVHILITHVPYIFDSNGKIWDDEAFYNSVSQQPIDDDYLRIGYVSAIQFTNTRMLEILRQILEDSEEAPIIILQGDHGLTEPNRLQILSAYHLPENGDERLYPTITPVNSFRVVFDAYFEAGLGLLDDLSYFEGSSKARPNSVEACAGMSANK